MIWPSRRPRSFVLRAPAGRPPSSGRRSACRSTKADRTLQAASSARKVQRICTCTWMYVSMYLYVVRACSPLYGAFDRPGLRACACVVRRRASCGESGGARGCDGHAAGQICPCPPGFSGRRALAARRMGARRRDVDETDEATKRRNGETATRQNGRPSRSITWLRPTGSVCRSPPSPRQLAAAAHARAAAARRSSAARSSRCAAVHPSSRTTAQPHNRTTRPLPHCTAQPAALDALVPFHLPATTLLPPSSRLFPPPPPPA